MNEPDTIYLGPGDTAPLTLATLLGPDKEDGSDGDPLDLSGATVVFKYQSQSGGETVATRAVTVLSPATAGKVRIDWLIAGAVPPGDYNCRFVVTDASGHQISVPNNRFLWMKVAEDFTVVE